MRFNTCTLAALAASIICVSASSPFGQRHLWGRGGLGKLTPVRRQAAASSTPVPDSTCKHGPRNRACWTNGFSVATDFDLKHPDTGVTRQYYLEITNTTCNPDGAVDQQCLLINKQYPGPTIFADWGDNLEITVKNSMQDNGTGIHWHGVRQLNSNGQDGVDGVTACPIAPGDSYTYKFKVTQFGTSWYHSHFSSQYGAGVLGQLHFNGPSTANYDEDLGTFTVSDWYYPGAFRVNQLFLQGLQQGGPGPNADTILINGTAKSAKGGAWAKVQIESGKVYKLRLINPSTDNFIRVKLDNHPFRVISADFIPTIPAPVDGGWINFGPGQRHDVVFTANATAGNYWFRAEVSTDCFSGNNGKGRALFTYKGQTVAEPVDSNEVPPSNGCTETLSAPYWRQPVEQSTFDDQVKQLTTALTQAQVTTNGQNLVLWALNFTSMNVDWNYPTMQYLFDKNTNYPKSLDVIEIPDLGVWTYWIIQTLQATAGPLAIAAPPPPHPVHLHGHDFFVLGRGFGQFNRSTAALNFDNPPRRDTTTLPSRGWVAVAFPTNNPGAWLMHCHINWHISEGFGVQFLEAKDQIIMPDQTTFDNTCTKWKAFSANMPYPKMESGL